MTLTALPRAVTFAALVAASGTAALAQTTSADPRQSDTTVAQATPPSGMMGHGGAQPNQPGTMGQGMMGGMTQRRMMGMPGHMTKIMFAIADVNGDGALSFEEVTTIHKRIFDTIDANKDGKVTPEELQAFMRE